MAAGGEDLSHAGGPEAFAGAFQRGAKTRAARADHDDIERMLGNGISGHLFVTRIFVSPFDKLRVRDFLSPHAELVEA
jgi:hypothetical protein